MRPQSPAPSEPLPPPGEAQSERELALERELASARAQLEDLGSSNIEYQAINDELQSANEALLASREELQSVNQELQAINGELAERLTDLARVHGETANLLASTRLAILFVDGERRIRHFTPRLAELFALVDGDLGRPAASLGARLPYAELDQDVTVVIDNLTRARRQIRTPARARLHGPRPAALQRGRVSCRCGFDLSRNRLTRRARARRKQFPLREDAPRMPAPVSDRDW